MIKHFKAADAHYSTRLRLAERPGIMRTIAALLAHSGDSWFWLAGLTVVWVWGDATWKPLASRFIVAIIVTAIIVMTLKFTVRRQRPEGDWGGIYRRTDPHSFPSGHAARVVLLAILAIGSAPPWFGGLLAFWAPLVAFARVAMGLHYLSDILAGGLIGLVLGVIFLLI